MNTLKTIMLLAIAVIFTSCSKDDNNDTTTESISFSQVTTSETIFSERRWHKSIVFDSKLWVIGGEGYGDVWNSTNGVNWNEVTTTGGLSPQNAAGALLNYNNKLWLIGGFYAGPNSTNQVFNSTNGVNWDELYPTTVFSPSICLVLQFLMEKCG